MKTRINSFGTAVPKKIVTNKELEKLMDTSDEWIRQRSGVEERRWVEDETTLSLATEAAKQALKKANLTANDIDAIIFGALITDYTFPGTGCLLQKTLGCDKPIPALDIRNMCSGFLYALSIAHGWIQSGMYKKILIVGSEVVSTRMDVSTKGRDISVLFGDGAGACVVEASDDEACGLIDIQLASEGKNAEVLVLKKPSSNEQLVPQFEEEAPPDFYPFMDGKMVFKNAVTRMTESMTRILQRNNFTASDVDFVIAHQANMRINQMVLKQLDIPLEKTHHTLQKYGNTTMATIPITMGEAFQEGLIKRGDLVALTTFGAGFTWGSALLRF